jgi:hypothetical protein
LGTTLELRRSMVDRAHWLPPGYVLDVLDPEVVILRREDGSMVWAFSTVGSTTESIRHAAERDMHKQQDASSRRGSSRTPAA